MYRLKCNRLEMLLLLVCVLASSGVARSQQASLAVSEDARRYYVQANTHFKEAQSPDDYKQAVSLYQQALQLAPHFGNAWYNLSKAQEKLQQYDDAITSLKHFLADSPNDPEARTAQDHVYELEVKRDAKAKVIADQKRAMDASQLQATWAQSVAQQIRSRFAGLTVTGMLACGREIDQARSCTKEEAAGNNWYRLNPSPGQGVIVDLDPKGRVRFTVSFLSANQSDNQWFSLCGTPRGPSIDAMDWAECEPSQGQLPPEVSLDWTSNGHKAIRLVHWCRADGRCWNSVIWEF